MYSDDSRSDLLAHKHRPLNVKDFICHPAQAHKLKSWILDFNETGKTINSDYDEDSSSLASANAFANVTKRCALLTGPPGAGKTSLVYAVASELGMHVVESHPSEKRDSKLFSNLKQTNQKGKINPIARLFQCAQNSNRQRDETNGIKTKRKKRRIDNNNELNGSNLCMNLPKSQSLSVSGQNSILLFDDIDVVFEDDGPFLKSLVEFIRETKRPIVMTATKSLDHIKDAIVYFEHIHLPRPSVEDCTRLLSDICKKESHLSKIKKTQLREIAIYHECDIRQSLNSIHFYSGGLEHTPDDATSEIRPNFLRLSDHISDCDDKSVVSRQIKKPNLSSCKLMNCYTSRSLVDILESKFNLVDKPSLLQQWLDGKPSLRNEEHTHNHHLGEEISSAIQEINRSLLTDQMMTKKESNEMIEDNRIRCSNYNEVYHIINNRIKSRIEPPEEVFHIDMTPMFSYIARLEANRRSNVSHLTNGDTHVNSYNGLARRSRRTPTYMDLIEVYLEPGEIELIRDDSMKLDDTNDAMVIADAN